MQKSMLCKQPQMKNKQAECSRNWELVIKKQYKKNTGIVWIPVPFFPLQVKAEAHGDDPEEVSQTLSCVLPKHCVEQLVHAAHA